MQFTQEINHLMRGILIAFVIVALSGAYWAISGEETILQRDDNPRLVEASAAIRRGTIYSRHRMPLAETVVINDLVERQYDYAAMYSALGYYSLRYGVGGAEAAYDGYLSGDALPNTLENRFEQDVLHRPQEGADIRLTFDLDVQQQIADAMGNRRGAAVVLSVPDGGILSLVSQPTYNPNTLTDEWDTLITMEGNPFFNRVLQGQYQPGGMMQTPLMAAAYLTNQPLDTIISDATRSVPVDDTTLTCAMSPPENNLTIIDAYHYACPYPFVQLADQINDMQLRNVLNALRLDTPPTLQGFTVDLPDNLTEGSRPLETTPEATPPPTSDNIDTIRNDILGQGNRTVNPLSMASLAAAIINDGNAPAPYALMAIRPPDADWQSVRPTGNATPLMTTVAANRMRDLMQKNIQSGTAASAKQDGLPIGGHAALAYSGEETQAWFIGFVVLDDNRGAAVAVVLEDENDAQAAATIGGVALDAAYTSLQQETAPGN